jgi:hypothetical protein
MYGIERKVIYGVLGVLLAGTIYLWRRIEAACETRTVITRDSVETGTLKAGRIVVSDGIELVRRDGKTVGYLISGPQGGYLNLFDPDPPRGSASIGRAPFQHPTEPGFTVWAGLGDTGVAIGTTPAGQLILRTRREIGKDKIAEVDYSFDGETLSRTPPR